MVTLLACAGLSSPVTSFRLAIRGAVVSGMVGLAQGWVPTICDPQRGAERLHERPDDALYFGLEATIGGRGVIVKGRSGSARFVVTVALGILGLAGAALATNPLKGVTYRGALATPRSSYMVSFAISGNGVDRQSP